MHDFFQLVGAATLLCIFIIYLPPSLSINNMVFFWFQNENYRNHKKKKQKFSKYHLAQLQTPLQKQKLKYQKLLNFTVLFRTKNEMSHLFCVIAFLKVILSDSLLFLQAELVFLLKTWPFVCFFNWSVSFFNPGTVNTRSTHHLDPPIYIVQRANLFN